MNDFRSIQFDQLFDADEYYRSGNCPWTFFAYPTSLSVERNLPPDVDACCLLASLQKRGVRVAIWVSNHCENTTFFTCIKEDIESLQLALKEISVSGMNAMEFCTTRTQELFALIELPPK